MNELIPISAVSPVRQRLIDDMTIRRLGSLRQAALCLGQRQAQKPGADVRGLVFVCRTQARRSSSRLIVSSVAKSSLQSPRARARRCGSRILARAEDSEEAAYADDARARSAGRCLP